MARITIIKINKLNKYSKDTKIVVGHDMKHKMNGFDLAYKLHESGYTKLWMR
ncbi:MAG: hypothetical protein LE178_03880 [Endomicrobium sp.]|nr:hypothetical protein [Endomicrobium sp.]